MGTFGERLQREREMRGITLEEIAEATKIGTRSLRALEEQDFDKLPGGIFNKGFVRAYSKYLGIDEDQAVADYVTAVSEAQSAGKLTRPEYAPPTFEESETDYPERVRIPWALLIIVALVVAIGFAAKSYYSKGGSAKLKREVSPESASKAPQQTPVPVAEQPAVTPPAGPAPAPPAVEAPQKQAVVPAVQASANGTTANAAAAPDGFVVKVRAREDAWVEISADGKRVVSELMKADTDKLVRARTEVVLVTGNAGGIEVSRNDQMLPLLGNVGAKKSVTITAQDVR